MFADMSANRASLLAGREETSGTMRSGRPAARLARLYLGLAGFGLSLALMVRARLGLGPWDVLHQGIARHLGVRLGWVTIGPGGRICAGRGHRPGTLAYALSIGPLTRVLLPRLTVKEQPGRKGTCGHD